MFRRIKNHSKLSCLVISDDAEKKLEGQKIWKIMSGIDICFDIKRLFLKVQKGICNQSKIKTLHKTLRLKQS